MFNVDAVRTLTLGMGDLPIIGIVNRSTDPTGPTTARSPVRR
jgi:hypothetical protein